MEAKVKGIWPPCHHSTFIHVLLRWIMGLLRPSGYLRSTNRWKSSKGLREKRQPTVHTQFQGLHFPHIPSSSFVLILMRSPFLFSSLLPSVFPSVLPSFHPSVVSSIHGPMWICCRRQKPNKKSLLGTHL